MCADGDTRLVGYPPSTSAFIIGVNSELKLKPDPGDGAAALLFLLINKIDKATFGSNVLTLQQCTGPPRAIASFRGENEHLWRSPGKVVLSLSSVGVAKVEVIDTSGDMCKSGGGVAVNYRQGKVLHIV